MNLLEQALGNQWAGLAPVIRQHYQLDQGGRAISVSGDLQVQFPNSVWLLIRLLRIFGALIDLRGEQLAVRVDKWTAECSNVLFWRRVATSRQGQRCVFESHMKYGQANELIEFIGFGLGVRLRVSACDGDLIYQSTGYVWQVRNRMIRLPDWLTPGQASIIEQAVDERRFALKFQIHHPFFGLVYAYQGIFSLDSLA